MGEIPKAISESEVDIAGIKLKVAVLEDGRRIIEAESFARFWEALSDPNFKFGQEDADKVAKLIKQKGVIDV